MPYISDSYVRYVCNLSSYMGAIVNINDHGFFRENVITLDAVNRFFTIHESANEVHWFTAEDEPVDPPALVDIQEALVNNIPEWNAKQFAEFISVPMEENWYLWHEGEWVAVHDQNLSITEDSVKFLPMNFAGELIVFQHNDPVRAMSHEKLPPHPGECLSHPQNPGTLISAVDRVAAEMGYFKTVDMYPYLRGKKRVVTHVYSSIEASDVLVLDHDTSTGTLTWLHDNGDNIDSIDPIPVNELKSFFVGNAPKISPSDLYRNMGNSDGMRYQIWMGNKWENVTYGSYDGEDYSFETGQGQEVLFGSGSRIPFRIRP